MRALRSARLGADFTRLWAASAVSNLGDGITLAAGPLLVASLTGEPLLVAGAAFAQQLPWLLVAPLSGVYVDRLDRRRLIIVVNVLRGLAVAGLAVAIAASAVSIPLIYAVFFLLGVGETLADTAFGALIPATVAADRLTIANSRLATTTVLGNQILSKPLGGWLFASAAALPFAVDAITFLAGAALIAAMRVRPPRGTATGRVREDVRAGLRWLWRHRLLRTLAVTMGVANVAFCAAFAVFALLARERLGLAAAGYGFLLAAFGVGGLVGGFLSARVQRAVPARVLLRGGLVVEVVTHAVLAATTEPLLAGAVLAVFGAHGVNWGIIVATLLQRSVPDGLRGRVGSVYSLVQVGGAAAGSLLGGLVGQVAGVTATFWAASAAMAAITVVSWRPLAAA
ncbi:MFS transporter [Nonomuraea longicatena]|uniref:MFS transporter n=1 Tax=Nonomuraea longicatena TaxID=83682 RepID=A0ABP4A113_9ACTN